MDPSTPAGERQLPTALDYAGFADIGWQVSAVPEPVGWAMLLSGFGVVTVSTRRRRMQVSETIGMRDAGRTPT